MIISSVFFYILINHMPLDWKKYSRGLFLSNFVSLLLQVDNILLSVQFLFGMLKYLIVLTNWECCHMMVLGLRICELQITNVLSIFKTVFFCLNFIWMHKLLRVLILFWFFLIVQNECACCVHLPHCCFISLSTPF